MKVRDAIVKAKAKQVISAKNLKGNDLKNYQEWIKAFINDELSISKSLGVATTWILENTAANCSPSYLKREISVDVQKGKNERERSNRERKKATPARCRKVVKRTPKKKTKP